MHYLSFCRNASRSIHTPPVMIHIPRPPPIVLPRPGKKELFVRYIEQESQSDAVTIDMQTPMRLTPPVALRIRSQHTVHAFIDGRKWVIKFSKPTTIAVISSLHTVHLRPIIPLGSEFVRGWNKLPNELAYQIISQSMMTYPRRQHYFSPRADYQNLFAYSRMTPQIACCATVAFYRENEWLIQLSSTGKRRYPPRPLNNFIRRLVITMYLRREHFQFLRKLAEGKLGFEGLTHLYIQVDWHHINPVRNDWEGFLAEEPINFSCKGDVIIFSTPSDLLLTTDDGVVVAPMINEGLMRKKIHFDVKNA